MAARTGICLVLTGILVRLRCYLWEVRHRRSLRKHWGVDEPDEWDLVLVGDEVHIVPHDPEREKSHGG